MRGPHNPSSFFVVLYIRDARIKRTELKRVKAHLERLAGGRSNDPSRWEKSENKADIYRILLHLEWSEAHPESLGFLRPKELRQLEPNAAGTVSVQDNDDVIYIEEKKVSSQQDWVDADDFVGLEEHWNQVFIYTFAHAVSKP
jgi:ribosomal protein L32E